MFSIDRSVDPTIGDSVSDKVPGKGKLFVVLELCDVKVVGEVAEIGLSIGVKVKQESTVDMWLKW